MRKILKWVSYNYIWLILGILYVVFIIIHSYYSPKPPSSAWSSNMEESSILWKECSLEQIALGQYGRLHYWSNNYWKYLSIEPSYARNKGFLSYYAILIDLINVLSNDKDPRCNLWLAQFWKYYYSNPLNARQIYLFSFPREFHHLKIPENICSIYEILSEKKVGQICNWDQYKLEKFLLLCNSPLLWDPSNLDLIELHIEKYEKAVNDMKRHEMLGIFLLPGLVIMIPLVLIGWIPAVIIKNLYEALG